MIGWMKIVRMADFIHYLSMIGCGSAQCSGQTRTICTYSGGGKGKGIGNPLGQPDISTEF